jgi:hypothetical protein
MVAVFDSNAMKRFFAAALTLAVFTGCETLSDATSNVRDRFAARDDGRKRNYTASPRATYQAVRTAAEQMGYRFQRGGAAQGFFEGISGIGRAEVGRDSRQVAMKVTLRPSLDEGTEVSILLTEIIESESANRAPLVTEGPLQGTPQYEVFFRSVQQALDGQGSVDRRQ